MPVDERKGVLLPIRGPSEALLHRSLESDFPSQPRIHSDLRNRHFVQAYPSGKDIRCNEDAAPFAALQQVFAKQLIVGQHYRVARDTELRCELSR